MLYKCYINCISAEKLLISKRKYWVNVKSVCLHVVFMCDWGHVGHAGIHEFPCLSAVDRELIKYPSDMITAIIIIIIIDCQVICPHWYRDFCWLPEQLKHGSRETGLQTITVLWSKLLHGFPAENISIILITLITYIYQIWKGEADTWTLKNTG